MNKALKIVISMFLPPLSILFVVLFNNLMIASDSKTLYQILSWGVLCIGVLGWLYTIRTLENETLKKAIVGVLLFIVVMLFAYTYLSDINDEVTLFTRMYNNDLLIWLGILLGYALSLLFIKSDSNTGSIQ